MNLINEQATTDEMDEVIHDAVFAEKKAIIAHARKTEQRPSLIAKKLINQIRIALADDKSLNNFSQFRQKAAQLVDAAVNNNFQDPSKASKTTRKAVVRTTTTDKNVSPLATRLSKNLKRDDKWDGKVYTARLVDKEGKVVYQGSAKGPIERSRSKAINRMNASMPPVSDLNETKKIFENYFKQNLNENLEGAAGRLAMALARTRDKDNSKNTATVDIANIPDGQLEKEKESFRKFASFRKMVMKKVPGYLKGIKQIQLIDPDVSGAADSDPINRLKQKHGATTTTRGIKESFEETPFGQLVADEINRIVAEMPEIKLGLEVLAEQEEQGAETEELAQQIQKAGRDKAMQIMTAFKTKLDNEYSEMIQQALGEIASQ